MMQTPINIVITSHFPEEAYQNRKQTISLIRKHNNLKIAG